MNPQLAQLISHLQAGTQQFLPGSCVGLSTNGADRPFAPLGAHLTEYFKGFDPDPIASRELFEKAMHGDGAALLSLNRLRVEQVNNIIVPNLLTLKLYFEIVQLADDEVPVLDTGVMHETTVDYLAESGDFLSLRVDPDRKQEIPTLKRVASKAIEYPLEDIYQGRNIAETVLRTVDVAFDIAKKMESYGETGYGTAFGSFTTTGDMKDRTFVLDSSINAANLPTTNILTADGANTETAFGFEVFDAILEYCAKFGGTNYLNDGQPLAPTGVIRVPSSDSTGLLKQISPTGAQNNPVANGVWADYMHINYVRDWVLVPDARIAPGTCYPQLNKPVGRLYLKPGMDKVYDTANTMEAQMAGRARRMQSKVMGIYIPKSWTPHALKVTYRTA